MISYLVFNRSVAGIQDGRTIDLAFSVSVDEKGEVTFHKSKHPYISVYFPTETESKLEFIVQGPYRTTPNRSSVPADDRENIRLAEQTAELLRDSLRELRDIGMLNLSLLNILPIDSGKFESTPLFKCMYDMTVKMLKEEQFLISKNNSYISPDNAKIARGNDFSEVFTDELLTELIDDGKEYHWLPLVLTETNKRYKDLYSFLTDILKIEVMRPENMSKYFNANEKFLSSRDDEWLVKLYTMYEKVGGAFSKQRSSSNMLTAKFIKTSKGTFVSPYRRSDRNQNYRYSFLYQDYEKSTYLPNVFLPSKNMTQMYDIPFVDEKIYDKCGHFFKEILALQKPNEYELFIRDFEKRYKDGMQMSDEQHIADVKHLLKYRTNGFFKEEIENLIKKYLVLKCIKDGNSSYISPFKENVFFSKTKEGLSIEYYFKNIQKCAYVDLDFYLSQDVKEDDLSLLGVSREIAIGQNKITGEYPTGKPGRKPEWTTPGTFRWKLTLKKLDEVLEYISKHPKESDSMAKSAFIFCFLKQNENHLTGDVYIGGGTPNKHNEFSEIVNTLRHSRSSCHYYESSWNGKWLFTKSGKLVSQNEISKRDLHTPLYGDIDFNSKIYDILGFAKNNDDELEDAEKDYDRLSDKKKNRYFEIEFQRRYGYPVEEAEVLLEEKSIIERDHGKQFESGFEFPSSNVKNWDLLRKHVAEVLCFANPVKYEYVVHSIRVSKSANEVQAYLKNMYRIDGKHMYACQMCHDIFSDVEMCQIANKPKVELDAMNLCMCPNCAREYKKIRANSSKVEAFLKHIVRLNKSKIKTSDPVEVDLDDESIWFTQSHVAEIKELMTLQKEAENCSQKLPVKRKDENSRKKENDVTVKDETSNFNLNVYKEYIDKDVYHKGCKAHGTVIDCDDTYIYILFKDGDRIGESVPFSLKTCCEKNLLKLL